MSQYLSDETLNNCGNFEKSEDGFYYFWPYDRGGCYSEHLLDSISNRLKRLNKEWEEVIANDPRVSGSAKEAP